MRLWFVPEVHMAAGDASRGVGVEHVIRQAKLARSESPAEQK
jgi:hypothetical protein